MLNFANIFFRSTVIGLMVASDAVSNVVNSQTARDRLLTGEAHKLKVVSRYAAGRRQGYSKVTSRERVSRNAWTGGNWVQLRELTKLFNAEVRACYRVESLSYEAQAG